MTLRIALAVLVALGALNAGSVQARIQAQTEAAAAPPHMSAGEMKKLRKASEQAYRAGNYAECLRLMLPLAEAGDAEAQNNVATIYQDGLGVAPDYALAAKWYQLAADQGLATAENTLGVMYDEGQGVARDHDKAVSLFQRAAGHGDAYAQANLGKLYLSGNGVPQNYELAVTWLSRAAYQGFAVAELKLGYLYRDGHGVAQDDYTAYVWFNRALRDMPKVYYERDRTRLQPEAEAAKAAMAAKLTPAQIAAADKE